MPVASYFPLTHTRSVPLILCCPCLLVQFAVLEVVWLAELLLNKQQQQSGSVLAAVPESVLADAAAWLTFVIQQGRSEHLAAVPIGGGGRANSSCCRRLRPCLVL